MFAGIASLLHRISCQRMRWLGRCNEEIVLAYRSSGCVLSADSRIFCSALFVKSCIAMTCPRCPHTKSFTFGLSLCTIAWEVLGACQPVYVDPWVRWEVYKLGEFWFSLIYVFIIRLEVNAVVPYYKCTFCAFLCGTVRMLTRFTL